jgi:hypothetical protein
MAKGPKIKIKVQGVEDVLMRLGKKGANELAAELDNIVEANAIKIVNEAKENAPIRDGFLKRSIKLYGKPVMLRRTIGSDRPYAQRQEYEHATHKAYFRRALWNGRKPFRKDIRDEIKKMGG